MKLSASPEATGGIGFSYESASIAAYLAAMLADARAPGLPGRVVSVAMQQAGSGHPLDDLSLEWRDELGRSARLDLQLKHRLTVSAAPSNGNFADIVAAAWATLGSPSFRDELDCVGCAAEVIGTDVVQACQTLTDLARLESDCSDFLEKVRHAVGRKVRLAFEAVATLLTNQSGRTPEAVELHRFWRHFLVLRLEVTNDRGPDRARAIDQLSSILAPGTIAASQLFGILEALAKQLTIRAVRVDREQTVRLLRDRFATDIGPPPVDIGHWTTLARAASEAELEPFRFNVSETLIEPRFLLRSDDPARPPEPLGLAELEPLLRKQRVAVITGEPGTGKTQSLSQLADSLLSRSEFVPIVRSLPGVAQTAGLLDQIAESPSFLGIDKWGLTLLARSGRVVLLLDGWNELNGEQREWTWDQLDNLQRDFPRMIVVITTRAGAAAPLRGASDLEIRSFDRERQYETAERLFGDRGRELLRRVRAVPSLRELVRIPIFLTAMLRQCAKGSLPGDREEVIAHLVTWSGDERRRIRLSGELDGQHLRLLDAIAWALMTAGTTSMREEELLPIVAETCSSLRSQGLLVKPISPKRVVDLLTAHHLLVATGASDARTLQFQHQLIQEWFASRRVEHLLKGQGEAALDPALLKIVDDPFWSISLLLAGDRLARSPLPPVAVLRRLLLVMLGIAPFLAADMLRRVRAICDSALEREIEAFAERWEQETPDRALAFMLATGLPRFGPRLWTELERQRHLSFDLRHASYGFPAAALMPGWKAHFEKLAPEVRRVLLIDLIEEGDNESLNRVIAAAKIDPEASVVAGVVDYLDFYEEHAALDVLLSIVSEKVWRELVKGRMPEGMKEEHQATWREYRRARFDKAEGYEWINLALEFDCAAPREIIERALDFQSDDHWNKRGLEERVAERFPAEFQAILIERLLEGRKLPFDADKLLTAATVAEQDQLLKIALLEEQNYYVKALVGQLLDGGSIRSLVDHMVAVSGDRTALTSAETRRVRDLLRRARLNLLVTDVLERRTQSARDATMLAELLADWRGDRDGPAGLPLAELQRSALTNKLAGWAKLALADSTLSRHSLAEMARLIGRLGDEALLEVLLSLWDRDRRQLAEQRAARAADAYRGGHDEASWIFDNQYRDAFVGIGGKPVIDAMTERLADRACEVDAAIVLGQLLETDPLPREAFGPRLQELAARRDRLRERSTQSPAEIPAMILNRIDALVAAGDRESRARAFQLAGPVLLMNYGDGAGSLRGLLESGHENHLVLGLSTAFAERGELLPTGIVRSGLDVSIADLNALSWASENDHWRVNAWLRLVAFADDPRAALPDLAALPAATQRLHVLRSLVTALGYSPAASAPAALAELARAFPKLVKDATWANALAALGTPAATEVFFETLRAGEPSEGKGGDGYVLRTAFGQLLAGAGVSRDRAFALLEELERPAQRSLLAAAIAEALSEDDAIKLLRLVDWKGWPDVAQILVERLENVAIQRRPIDGTNMLELEATALTRLRREAFQIVLDERPGASVARACLIAIDRLRDRYGKPVVEPYHPNLTSMRPWPLVADQSWAAAGAQ